MAGVLIGYGLSPLQASFQECWWQGCLDRAAAEPADGAEVDGVGATYVSWSEAGCGGEVRETIVRRIGRTRQNGPRADKDRSPRHLDRAAESLEPVLNKAKVAVAAKMEDPSSVEFGDMKRAFRKNTLGKPVDTVCGYVKGKDAFGSDTGDRPFLYLVKEDDAYVVVGKTNSAAAIAYRNICN